MKTITVEHEGEEWTVTVLTLNGKKERELVSVMLRVAARDIERGVSQEHELYGTNRKRSYLAARFKVVHK